MTSPHFGPTYDSDSVEWAAEALDALKEGEEPPEPPEAIKKRRERRRERLDEMDDCLVCGTTVLAIGQDRVLPCGHDTSEALPEPEGEPVDLDRCCVSIGPVCVHCNQEMPSSEDSPRLCPAINDGIGDDG